MTSYQKIPVVESTKIYTRRTQGFYQRLRRYSGIPLLGAYFLLPWLTIEDRQAVLFDISSQKFHIFWLTLWPQDGILLAWLLMIAAVALFAVTVMFGRVWCGFTCPQTLWTLMFIWAEDKCEGDRHQRIRLDQQAWSTNKLLRKTAKHSIWLTISFATGFTFVAYFYGGIDLATDALNLNVSYETLFWVGLFTLLTYMNAGWLREQVCKHMCPYARFQSVMYDEDTLLVTYDKERGDKGDCIDCSWCVQVCPADIDIRDGLQYACIDCGLCIDACDNVMEQIGKEKKLIRFSSLNSLKTGSMHFLRPRAIGYGLALIALSMLFVFELINIKPVSLDVVKDRGQQLFVSNDSMIENIYTVKINNKSSSLKDYVLGVKGGYQYFLDGKTSIQLEPGSIAIVPIRIGVSQSDLKETTHKLEFTVYAKQQPTIIATQTATFIGPALANNE